jgi:hypothetical protein
VQAECTYCQSAKGSDNSQSDAFAAPGFHPRS